MPNDWPCPAESAMLCSRYPPPCCHHVAQTCQTVPDRPLPGRSMIPRIVARAALCAVLSATAAAAQDRTMPPESERQLARAIYKEMIEIKTGYTTGATTPLA